MSTYKLHYFNGRGLGEVSRLIFTVAGQKFEDIRHEHSDWPSHKAEMPLGQMPVLEFNGVKLPQSLAIARFLAKQFQLAGKDNFEQAKVDAVVDTIHDLLLAFRPTRMEKDEVKKQEITKKFIDEELPKHFQNLETLGKLYGNGGNYFVGNQLTWADLLFYDFGQTFLDMDGNCLNNYSWLQKNRAEVEKQPKIAEYLKNRPKTPF
jgi:glutathione S-transferase